MGFSLLRKEIDDGTRIFFKLFFIFLKAWLSIKKEVLFQYWKEWGGGGKNNR